jgi:hypothetical protein
MVFSDVHHYVIGYGYYLCVRSLFNANYYYIILCTNNINYSITYHYICIKSNLKIKISNHEYTNLFTTYMS